MTEYAPFTKFVKRMRAFVLSRGVDWDFPLNERGVAVSNNGWDLRDLTRGHAMHAATLKNFAVDEVVLERCAAAGWNPLSLPEQQVLSSGSRDFIKALVADRCRIMRDERNTRDFANVCRQFLSSTRKKPWELTSDDFDRFGSVYTNGHTREVLETLASSINKGLLSMYCPIIATWRKKNRIQEVVGLNERIRKAKLPHLPTLFELARIVFQETPKSHRDLLYFQMLRIQMVTGLRINEIRRLPANCLQWTEHIDVVTGKPASASGGVGRSLCLNYFPQKQIGSKADTIVEGVQFIPEIFQSIVEEAVRLALDATSSLRARLVDECGSAAGEPNDEVIFVTDRKQTVRLSDLLFLCPEGKDANFDRVRRSEKKVVLIGISYLYVRLGVSRAGEDCDSTFFQRYGTSGETSDVEEAVGALPGALKTHALRHLLNTELFRLQVPDTVITHHFARKTVAQSYEYDHRTLSEKLDFIKLPDFLVGKVERGSVQELVVRLAVDGRLQHSHLGESFLKISRDHGEEAAFEYLLASCDGVHVTPFGICGTNFAANPCPRNLKCFDGCRNFIASGEEKHLHQLAETRVKFVKLRKVALDRPANSLGHANQIQHVDRLIAGVDRAIATQPGEAVFPLGVDHSLPEDEL